MATRKIKDAKDLSTNELIYFKGHAKATYMSDGKTVEEAINEMGGGEDVIIFDFDKLEITPSSNFYISDAQMELATGMNTTSFIERISTGAQCYFNFGSLISNWEVKAVNVEQGILIITWSGLEYKFMINIENSVVSISYQDDPVMNPDRVSQWGFTKNKGTVTKVKINGTEKTPDANGMVDLGTIEGGSGGSSNLPIASSTQAGIVMVDDGIGSEPNQIIIENDVIKLNPNAPVACSNLNTNILTCREDTGYFSIQHMDEYTHIVWNGDGTKFLADDGQYKTVSGGSEKQIITMTNWFDYGLMPSGTVLQPNAIYIVTVPCYAISIPASAIPVQNSYSQYTIIFQCSDAFSLSLPSTVRMSSEMPEFIEGANYELSIVSVGINGFISHHAVITEFKSTGGIEQPLSGVDPQ